MKKLIYLIPILFANQFIYAQFEAKSNELYNFSKIDFCQVDEYTGKAKISIPITTIKLDDIEIPISIDYLMGGIKVNELASTVGLGWYLNAGGKVTKNVKGVEDNKVDYYTLSDGIGSVKRGFLIDPVNYNADVPDNYSVNLPFLKTNFIIKKDLSIAELENYNENKIAIVRDYTNSRISEKYGTIRDYTGSRPVCGEYFLKNHLFTYNSLLTLNSCPYTNSEYIDTQSININNNGYLYEFNDWEHTFQISGKGTSYYDPLHYAIWSKHAYHSAYNLSRLTSLKTNKTVNFDYRPVAMEDSNTITERIWNSYTPEDNQGDIYVYPKIEDYIIYYPNIYFIQRLQKITSEEKTIEFNYENSRIDLKGASLAYDDPNYRKITNEQLLKSIVIRNMKGDIVWTFLFTYSYFNSGCDANDPKCNRLKLEKIEKFPGNNLNSSSKEEHRFSYFEDTNLPPLGFGKKDAFGYSNGLGNLTLLSPEIKKPKLYLYTENENTTAEKSYYSTFYIPQMNPFVLDGEDTSSTLENTRAWSLKSIEYPTKGKQEFEYELNTFKWKNQTFIGGGLRIKNINLINNNIIAQRINYNYLNNNETSGRIISPPKFTSEQFCYDTNQIDNLLTYAFYTTISSTPQLELTKGSNVGYGKVTISKTNNGKTVKQYETPETKPNFITNDSSIAKENIYSPPPSTHTSYNFPPILLEEDNDFLRGQIINEKIYNNANLLVKESLFSYQTIKKDSIKPFIYFRVHHFISSNTQVCNNSRIFSQPFNRIHFRRNNLIQKKIIDYYTDGLFENTVNYYYNDLDNTQKKIGITDSKAKAKEELFFYPKDFPSDAIMQGLIKDNRTATPVKTQTFRQGTKISEKETKYSKDVTTANLILPKYVYINKRSNSTKNKKTSYDHYDEKGNILQYTEINRAPTSIIWGYNKTQPIAEIENATYAQVSSYATNLQNISNTGTEADLIAGLQALRMALPNHMITTYTYLPLVGISTATDSKGFTTFYEYDDFNRLKVVKDNLGNLVSENKYRYKN